MDIRDRDIDGDGSERQKFTVSSAYATRTTNVSIK